MFEGHKGPVLCSTWTPDGSRIVTGGVDQTAKLWNPQTKQGDTVARHDNAIKECFFVGESGMLVTGSWDKTLRYWDVRSPGQPKATVNLPERCYSMDVKQNMIVVATAERYIVVYDFRKPNEPYKTVNSVLKFQSRCVAAFPDCSGFVLGSIEGRVMVHTLKDPKNEKKSYAFKCHRKDKDVYAVNSICFNDRYGSFATAGSDGVYCFWDKDKKLRLKEFQRMPQSITCSVFNRDASVYAYGLSYDWSRGADFYDKRSPNLVMLHKVTQDEMRPKESRS
jgi:mRNA export factor